MSKSPIAIIKEYVKLLIQEYEFEEETLLKVWTDAHPSEEKVEEKLSDKYSALKKKKNSELQEMCRQKGYKVNGTKLVLIDRLLGKELPPAVTITKTKSSKKTNKKTISDVLQKIVHNSNVVNIRRNLFNNYEHAETSFIFDESTHSVVGKQINDGTIRSLTAKDIETCKEYNFKFNIPDTIETEKPYDDEIMYE